MGRLGRPRHRRTGTEPVTALSDLRLRLLLSVIFVPVFVAGAVLFGVWWLHAETGGGLTSRGAIGAAALVCAAVAVFAVIDLAIVLRRLRRNGRRGP